MKILWIEDFGAGDKKNPDPESLAKSIFQEILTKPVFDDLDEDEDFVEQFSSLVKQHTIHEIEICKNYKTWKNRFEKNFDFDIMLIDINLEEGSSSEDIPEGFPPNFHKKAGFYIYHEILKKGVPDNNIAFFTGETGSYSEFESNCKKNVVPLPANVFEKGRNDNQEIRAWNKEKSQTPYINLRRAIINSVSELDKEISEEKIIFNKTIPKGGDPLTTDEVQRYLSKLKHFFQLNKPSQNNYYRFVKELSDLWERSLGYIEWKEKKNFDLNLEYNFKNFCQNQMKLLRNWTAHNQLSQDLTEKELSFYYMIAIRALLNSDMNTVYRYEKILFSLFDEDRSKFKSDKIKKNLAKSYFNLRNVYAKSDNPSRNEFKEVLKDIGIRNLSDKYDSIKYFYQNLWHGLFQARLSLNNPGNKDSVQMFVNFYSEDLEKSEFLTELANSIYKLSFE